VCSSSSESRPSTLHHPHPNIVDELRGTITSDLPAAAAAADGVVVAHSNGDAAAAADSDDDDDDDDLMSSSICLDDDISEQLQIPRHVYTQHHLTTSQQHEHS